MVWLAVNTFWNCHTCWLLENVRYLHKYTVERPMFGAGAVNAVLRNTATLL